MSLSAPTCRARPNRRELVVLCSGRGDHGLLAAWCSKGYDSDGVVGSGENRRLRTAVLAGGILPVIQTLTDLGDSKCCVASRIGGRILSLYVAATVLDLSFIRLSEAQTVWRRSDVGLCLALFLVAIAWLSEASLGETTSPHAVPWWKYWLVPLHFWRFGIPESTDRRHRLAPSRSGRTAQAGILYNDPIYMAFWSLLSPCELTTLRITSLVGVVAAVQSLRQFPSLPGRLWWNGVCTCLVGISGFGIALPCCRRTRKVK